MGLVADVVKTRFQLAATRGASPSILGSLTSILKNEGFFAMCTRNGTPGPARAGETHDSPNASLTRIDLPSLSSLSSPSSSSSLFVACVPPDRGILPPLMIEPVKRAVKFSAQAKYKQLIVGDGKMTAAAAFLSGAYVNGHRNGVEQEVGKR